MNIPICSNMYQVLVGHLDLSNGEDFLFANPKPTPVPAPNPTTFVSIKLHHQGSNGQARRWAWQKTGGRARHCRTTVFWRFFWQQHPILRAIFTTSLECLEASRHQGLQLWSPPSGRPGISVFTLELRLQLNTSDPLLREPKELVPQRVSQEDARIPAEKKQSRDLLKPC